MSKKGGYKHVPSSRASFFGLSNILASIMTVNDWLSREEISNADILAYPNAQTAAQIKSSPLGKALE